MSEQSNKAHNLWQKLFEIQKSIKTFSTKEDSDKTDSNGKPAYRYTPGWEIIEKLREEMDKRKIMLLSNCVNQKSILIDYPIYKDFHGTAMSFSKKEMYVEVSIEFTWIDTETGETCGPYTGYGYGANGTDKSGATAMSMAKRYFLLNFFNFTTRELTDEQDAHDMGNIPGMSRNEQPRNLAPGRIPDAVPAPQAIYPQAQPSYPQAPGYAVPPFCPVAPGYQQPVQQYQGNPAPQNGYIQPQAPPVAAPQPQQGAGFAGEFNQSDPAIQQAVSNLVNFEKGTPSHQRCLNEQVGKLAVLGYKCMNKDFLEKLVTMAENIRKGAA